ncbi:glycosyl transferase [Nocardioides sp. Soil797]|nr:glycosyl transferase [Nocardioides sp. Soil797]
MLVVSMILGVVAAGLVIPFAAVTGLTAGNVADGLEELPDELEAEALPQRTRILAADGTSIATLYAENRVNVSLSQVSKKMRQAIVSIEDYRFYQHGAMDVKGTLRAFVTNQASGETRQGGSSITQQMVKLTLVSQAKTKQERKEATDDTFARKLRELRYAIAFEKKYSKDWILERYLNIAYFGDGVYGIQAAAKHYFSKDASALNLRESATLAGLVKNPNGYGPIDHPDKALDRRNTVLDRMAQLNVIPQKRAEKTSKMPLKLKVTKNNNGCLLARAPFFCDYVVSYLKRDPSLGKTPKQRMNLLKSGGLTIRTTIDLRFQDAADKSVAAHVRQNESAIGALAMIEPGTGAVKALAQSRPMGLDDKLNETTINYTTPKEVGGARGFQAGSTFKVFVLAQAIRQGVSLNTTIDSPAERTFQEADYKNCDGQPYGYGSFSIPNSTTSGPKTLYTGTRESVNTFFMALEQVTGLCAPFRLAKEMGVNLTTPTGPSAERVPTFTLGVADATPLEMAEAYATFAARGLHCDARPVNRIEDANGTLVKKYPSKCTQLFSNAVADAVNDILRGVQEGNGFGAINGLALNQESAGKTGTTNSANSVWFAGYTPNLAAASMIAGVNEGGGPDSLIGKVIGGRTLYSASGSGTAGPMWGDAMHVVQQWLADETFVAPNTSEIQGVSVGIPSLGGMSTDAAKAKLEELGFSVMVGSQVDSSYARGTVAYTSPGAGETGTSGSVVTIYPSDGTPYVPPPPKKNTKPKKNGGDDKPGRGRGRGRR